MHIEDNTLRARVDLKLNARKASMNTPPGSSLYGFSDSAKIICPIAPWNSILTTDGERALGRKLLSRIASLRLLAMLAESRTNSLRLVTEMSIH
jgi:hypothetical protein